MSELTSWLPVAGGTASELHCGCSVEPFPAARSGCIVSADPESAAAYTASARCTFTAIAGFLFVSCRRHGPQLTRSEELRATSLVSPESLSESWRTTCQPSRDALSPPPLAARVLAATAGVLTGSGGGDLRTPWFGEPSPLIIMRVE